jgi:hypothetical protein
MATLGLAYAFGVSENKYLQLIQGFNYEVSIMTTETPITPSAVLKSQTARPKLRLVTPVWPLSTPYPYQAFGNLGIINLRYHFGFTTNNSGII